MKRVGDLYWRIAEKENLELAFWKAQRGKSQRSDVCEFRAHLDCNLTEIREELLSGNVRLGNYRYFMISDPKPRKICAAEFRERVLHHAVVNICEPYFEKQQIFDSYACRIGKGVDKCLARTRFFCHRYPRFLQCDIHKFFDSVDHKILLTLLDRHFKDPHLLDFFDRVIASYETSPDRGLPIGNLLSQYFANFYLSLLDHEVKERWQFHGYLRYMDDFIFFEKDFEKLRQIQNILPEFLGGKLRLVLNKPVCNLTTHGIPFLSYEVYHDKLRLSLKAKRRFQSRVKTLTEEKNAEVLLPMLAFINRASSFGFCKKVFYGDGAKVRTA